MRFYIILFSVICSISVFAQTKKPSSVSAANRSLTVVTEPKSIVWINDVHLGLTDEAGKLLIRRVPATRQVLRVRGRGFKDAVQAILPTQKGDIKVTLVKTNDPAELAFTEAEILRETGKDAELEKAMQQYENALKLRPKFFEAHIGLARLLAANDSEEALSHVAQARKINPIASVASVIEGRIYKENYDLEKAIASFKRAIREGKGIQPEAHAGLGLLYNDQEEKQNEAIAELKLAIAQNYDADLILYETLGDILEKAQKISEAIKLYEKLLQIAPTYKNATAIRSIVVQLKKQLEENGEPQ